MMRRGATARFCKEGGGFGRIGVVVVSVCCKLVGVLVFLRGRKESECGRL